MAAINEDGQLLDEVRRDGSPAAFARLVERHAALVHGTCRRILGARHPHCEDAAQAVFVLLARNPGAIRDARALPGWLHRTAVHAAGRVLREQERRRRRERVAAAAWMPPPPPPDGGEWSDLAQHLDAAIAALPTAQREALIRFHLAGKPQAVIPAELGCSEAAVKKRVADAMANLRRFFARRGLATGIAAIVTGLAAESAEAAAPAAATAAFTAADPAISARIAQGVVHDMLIANLTVGGVAAAAALLLVAVVGLAGAAERSDALIDAERVDRPITVDGDAAERTGAAEHPLGTGTSAAGTFALRYNAANLYVLMRVRDDSPLRNSTSRFDAPMTLKGGDAVGLCFGPADGTGPSQRLLGALLDGEPVVVAYRPQSERKQPYTFASPVSTYTMDYVAPLPEAAVAFRAAASGYTAEWRIPWSVLGYRPTAGLTFPFDAQVILSDPSGTRNVGPAWWHSRTGGALCTVDVPTEAQLYADEWGRARLSATTTAARDVAAEPAAASTQRDADGATISFTMPRAAKASLVVTDDRGWIVAEPLRAEPLPAGPQTVTWNGRGYRGMPMPPGT